MPRTQITISGSHRIYNSINNSIAPIYISFTSKLRVSAILSALSCIRTASSGCPSSLKTIPSSERIAISARFDWSDCWKLFSNSSKFRSRSGSNSFHCLRSFKERTWVTSFSYSSKSLEQFVQHRTKFGLSSGFTCFCGFDDCCFCWSKSNNSGLLNMEQFEQINPPHLFFVTFVNVCCVCLIYVYVCF